MTTTDPAAHLLAAFRKDMRVALGETVVEQVDRTGLHPITTGAPRRRGRHAARWTAARALEDARLGLECYQSTGRRVDRPGMLGNAFPLLPHEAEAAVWTMGVLQ